MTCRFSKEQLALHVEGDLPGKAAEAANAHLRVCPECDEFFEDLQARQHLVKSLRMESPNPTALSHLRREVMDRIDAPAHRLGWRIAAERFLVFCFRGHRYAAAGLALTAIVSISLLAQVRNAGPGEASLLRPEGYRNWRQIDSGAGAGPELSAHSVPGTSRKVYVSPEAYREYASTGRFPDGSVFVLESANADGVASLQASVKDNARFDGGWGFFNFTVKDGNAAATAQATLNVENCRSCHEERADTDHVFTQFYPALRGLRSGRPVPSPVPSGKVDARTVVNATRKVADSAEC